MIYPYARSVDNVDAKAKALEVCQALLSSPQFSAVNAVNCTGLTALHLAAFARLGTVCETLL